MQKNIFKTLAQMSQTVFSFKELMLIFRTNNVAQLKSRLHYHVSCGDLYPIRRGLYAKNRDYDRLELATKIFTPAYISFETVLAKAGIIFQYYSQIFVASYQSREVICDGAIYIFRKTKPTILVNTAGIDSNNRYSIACAERAFLDIVYRHKNYHFDNLEPLDWDKVYWLLPLYGDNKSMHKRVDKYHKAFKESMGTEETDSTAMQVMIKADMAAHKLVAMHERIGKTNRDIFDVWFFFKHHWPVNKKIVELRTGMTYKTFLQTCINDLEKMGNRGILSGIGELLDEKQKAWVKVNLRDETIFLLKLAVENELLK